MNKICLSRKTWIITSLFCAFIIWNLTDITEISAQGCPTFTGVAANPTQLINQITAANDETCHPGAQTITLTANIELHSVHNTDSEYGRNGLPIITSKIIIDGSGFTLQRHPNFTTCDQTTPDPAKDFRLFMVDGTGAYEGNLTLTNITLENGCADMGGVVLNTDGTVLIENSNVQDSFANCGSVANVTTEGQDVHPERNAVMRIESSTVTGHQYVGMGDCGAIANRGAIDRLLSNTIAVVYTG